MDKEGYYGCMYICREEAVTFGAALRSIADLESQEPLCPECKAEILYECVACSRNNYPPQRTWVRLTDEALYKAIEAKLKETSMTKDEICGLLRQIHDVLAMQSETNQVKSASDYERGVIDGMLKQAESSVDKAVKVSALEFVTMVFEKEHLVGKPIIWAQWPTEEKNT